MARKNYFLLLGLDPDKVTSWVAIEPQLRKKRNEWSMPHPTRKLEFQSYRSLLPDIEAVLKNDESRRSEAADARQILADEQAKALADLEEQLRFIEKHNGYLVPEDVFTICAHSGHKWSESDVRNHAAKIGVKIKNNTATKRAGFGIDEVSLNAIAKALSVVGADDLYELLALPRMSSSAELKQAADTEYQRVRTHGDKSKPEVNARQELYGYCLKLFDTDSERAKYDYSLACARLAKIEQFTILAGIRERRIDLPVLDELIIRGKQQGIEREDVVECVIAVARQRGWIVDGSNSMESDQRQLCGFCQTLGPANASACHQCGTPYRLICPKCGEIDDSFGGDCTNCGFAIDHMRFAQRCLHMSKAIARNDPEGALDEVNQSLAYWPGHADAIDWKQKLIVGVLRTDKQRHRIPKIFEWQYWESHSGLRFILPALVTIIAMLYLFGVGLTYNKNVDKAQGMMEPPLINSVKLEYYRPQSLVFTASVRMSNDKTLNIEVQLPGEGKWRKSNIMYTVDESKQEPDDVSFMCRIGWDALPSTNALIKFRAVTNSGLESAIYITTIEQQSLR
jgi:hypothetical protein